MSGLWIDPRITIPESEIVEQFIRASGPGGQNVNKVASAVQLRFDAARSPSLTEAVRQVLLASGRLTRSGHLVITAQKFREQERNRADARARLIAILRAAARPRRARKATKVPTASRRKRLDDKKHRARLKQGRGGAKE